MARPYLITCREFDVEYTNDFETPAEVVKHVLMETRPGMETNWLHKFDSATGLDLAIWDGPRLIAVLRDGPGGAPPTVMMFVESPE